MQPSQTATAPCAARPAIPFTCLAGLLRNLKERSRERRIRIRLEELDDHLLADIGLRREQLRAGRVPRRPF